MAICGGIEVTSGSPGLKFLDSPALGGGGSVDVLPGGTGTAPGCGGGGLLLDPAAAAVVMAGVYSVVF
jgi:hypothetical protein